MTTNDILRRLRYAFDLDDSKMITLFGLMGHEVTRTQVCDWLKRDEDPDYQECSHAMLATFLNGLIVDRRGRREGKQPQAEQQLSNNAVFMKLKIALDLKAEDAMEMLALGGHTLSKHELSALFRRPDHKHYRVCQDQVLRKFLRGLQIKHRGAAADEPEA